MTSAKAGLLERVRSEAEQALFDIVERWPLDVVTGTELNDLLGEDRPRGAALR